MRKLEYSDLRHWINLGLKYIVTEQLNGLVSQDEMGTFLVHPFTTEDSALKYIEKRVGLFNVNRQTEYALHAIGDESVIEMAEGVFGCDFFIEENLN